jgi:hypothetical protein
MTEQMRNCMNLFLEKSLALVQVDDSGVIHFRRLVQIWGNYVVWFRFVFMV